MELEITDYQRCLEEILPGVGRYGWMLALLRARFRKTGWFPQKLYPRLRRFGNPKKPYFLSKTNLGTAFCGDYRDLASVIPAVDPECNSAIARLIIQRLKRSPGAYLDVGTNQGVLAATVGCAVDGHSDVFAFEPIPETARRAGATFALNGVKNVRLFQMAIGESDGEFTMYNAQGNSGASSVHRHEYGGFTWEGTRVTCRSLDSLLQEGLLPRASLLKLDIEGHEFAAIRGSRQLIARDRPPLIWEYNQAAAPKAGWTAEDMAALINAVTPYRFYLLHEDGTLTEFPPSEWPSLLIDIYCESAAS
jgi:FkbM family methyltransferase